MTTSLAMSDMLKKAEKYISALASHVELALMIAET